MPLLIKIPRRRAWRWTRWFFTIVGVALLGYVGFALTDAAIFQAYEKWQMDRALNEIRTSPRLMKLQVVHASSALGEAVHVTPLAPGALLGRIDINSVGIAAMIVEGTDAKSLRRAVGHIPGTPLPGDVGNVVLTGHRDTFFRPLRNIQPLDEVTLTTLNGTFRYRVDSMQVVGDKDTEVLKDSEGAILTLVTCYPFYFVGPAPKRFIVRAHKI
jgi:sortase A